MRLWLAAAVTALCLLTTPTTSMATSLPTNITTDTTLTRAGGPYTGGWTYISSSATLTVEAGTMVKLEGGLVVHGRLVTEGTAEETVTFTSIKDDSAGGDTNKDGSATSPKAGDWPGIEFAEESGVPGPSKLLHTRVLYGGERFYPYHSMIEVRCPCATSPEFIDSTFSHSYTGAINVRRASPKIIGSSIVENAETGINLLFAGSPEVRANLVAHNSTGISQTVGEKEHMSVAIDENTVESNTYNGIQVSAPTGYTDIETASLGNNVVRKNGGKAIVYEAFPNSGESASFADNPIPGNITSNVVAENAKNGIWVAGEVTESEEWTAPSYALVVFNNGLAIRKGATLTFAPGTVVKDEERTIFANGILDSEGTAESPVTITSVKDDTVGGDTNGDGSATSPASGDWEGISYPSAREVELSYLDLRYAKRALSLQYLDSMLISNSDFVYNKEAIYVAETANNSPELAALSCVPPYLSFVISEDNWYGKTGYPPPNINLSGFSSVLPEEYAPLFSAALSLASTTTASYGKDNTIPWTFYECAALKIPSIPVTPVEVVSVPFGPWFPDPEME